MNDSEFILTVLESPIEVVSVYFLTIEKGYKACAVNRGLNSNLQVMIIVDILVIVIFDLHDGSPWRKQDGR